MLVIGERINATNKAVAEAIVRLLCEKNNRGSHHFVKFETNIHKLKELKNEIPNEWIKTFEKIGPPKKDNAEYVFDIEDEEEFTSKEE